MDSAIVLLLGIIAQVFYTARAIIQWVQSERHKRIESPTLFWVFSLIGSIFFFAYGWMRNDFSILFGELLSYYIYIWNLKAKGFTQRFPQGLLYVTGAVPLVFFALMLRDLNSFQSSFLTNADIPLWAVIWGSVGQFIYKMRFVYQWFYSVKRQESLLPVTFWWIAFVGSLMILIYSIYRTDYVLFVGQLGIIATVRNIIIGTRKIS